MSLRINMLVGHEFAMGMSRVEQFDMCGRYVAGLRIRQRKCVVGQEPVLQAAIVNR